jgi:RAB protein geranylgeranyltransferase component A
MSTREIPDRPMQPPLDYDVLSTAHDVEMEHRRVEMEDKHGSIDLKGKVLTCIARHAEQLMNNAEFADDTSKDYWLVSYDEMSELEDLLDDLKTIEQEGW